MDIKDTRSTVTTGAISRRRLLRNLAGAGAAVSSALVLAACQQAAPAPTQAPTSAPAKPTTASAQATTAPAKASAPTAAANATTGGTLKISYPTFYNPILHDADPVMSIMYNGLVNLSPSWDDIEPALAEKWTISSDQLKYTFNLRKDVKWHDGQPFTAADVEFTYTTILTKAVTSLYAKNLLVIKGASDFYDGKAKTIEGIKVLDDYTIDITLEKPTAPFLFNSMTESVIIPKHVWKDTAPEDLAKPATWEKKQIGTGPFKFNQFQADKFIEFVRNDDYFRGKPKIDKVLMVQVGTTPEAVSLALEKGDLDYATVPATEVDRMTKLPNLVIQPRQVYNIRFFTVNYSKPYFKDKRVHQALAYGIDRVGLCDSVLLKACVPTNTIAASQKWAASNLPKYEYNTDKAASLLKEAGWDPNQQVDLALYYGDQISKDYIAAVQQQLAKIGMKAKVVQLDGPAVTPYYYRDNKSDIMYAGFGIAPDMDVFRGVFSTDAFYPKGQNAIHYSNPKVDQLFDQGAAVTDFAARKKVYDELQTILADELPWVPLHFLKIIGGFNKRVQNGDSINNVWNRPYNWQLEKVVLTDGK